VQIVSARASESRRRSYICRGAPRRWRRFPSFDWWAAGPAQLLPSQRRRVERPLCRYCGAQSSQDGSNRAAGL